ncbi:hypothetical protein AAFF_G00340680 [Aldrovandia affinis]|uniref:Granulins domain-containing protein n=1 Tax=Aldrovandia affinis TaxID=143900 RepID=A0AAD7WPJ6_9TELE|nr:hypothetical protein AAFF_G00340680 [Aldrovandia affinis]
MLKSGVISLALLALAGAMTCPDGGACDDGSTCCQTSNGRYGCCPLPRSFPMAHASSGNEDDDDTVCPDKTHCPPEYSCLKSHNTHQCCPLAQGVSCSDGKHCCPEDHLCSADGHFCIKKKAGSVGAVICPDGGSECPEESTCCQLPDDSWGCCPLPKAVCCEDRVHCCHEGSTCDTVHSKCHSSTHRDTPMWEKLPARRRALWEDQTATNVPCNDSVACPDGNMCCKNIDGSWTCCPLPEAVCCDDHIHCCPKDTTCDLATGSCDGPTGSRPWLEKVPSLTRQPNKAGNVTCDPSHACPDGTTCCKGETGDWTCCPIPEAVCCDDHIHCCPKDTTCDVAAGSCDGPTGSRPWLEKVPSLTRQPNKAGNVTCDPSHACPDGTTCCKGETGDWACCPFPEAVCCDDHIHCCPKDTTCDVAAGSCDGPTGSRPWLEKVPSLTRQPNKAGNVACDSSHICPDGTTCCKGETGDWTCCFFPEAVCCDDHIHCCPKDTTCDLAAGSCDGPTGSRPWLEKVPSLTRQPNKAGNVTCDSSHACPDGTTCCKGETGDWACCPFPEAVCCDDHIHCCPKDTTCDLAAGSCDGPTGSRPWLEKVPSLTRQPNKAGNVPCDSSHICPDGSTCCKGETGDWACCFFPEAVCCSDMKHCCPTGYTCDLKTASCSWPGKLSWDNWGAPFRKRRPILRL